MKKNYVKPSTYGFDLEFQNAIIVTSGLIDGDGNQTVIPGDTSSGDDSDL